MDLGTCVTGGWSHRLGAAECARATGAISWLVTSGQIHELAAPATALRNALTTIAG